MEPAGRMSPQPWMTAPETAAVLAALSSDGDVARFVGGCVRDALLGRPVSDVDIATTGAAEDNIRHLTAAGIKAVPTGLAHGTLTAVRGHRHFEITTLRLDVETYGRHARVAYTDDWAADAARRDLTMNALYADADGTLYDPMGGRADLEAGQVRFVGDAATRIAEDRLRILRFFRFHAWYGHGAPAADALAACTAAAPEIGLLSAERVRVEVLKLLAAPAAPAVVRLMAEAGVLTHVLPGPADLDALDRLAGLEPAPEPLRRLAALTGHPDTAKRLRLSNAERDRLAFLHRPLPEVVASTDLAALRRAAYRHGAGPVADRLLLAGEPAAAAAIRDWTPPALPVAGADAVARGVRPGPRVGKLLAAVEAWWLDADFVPDRAQCLARLDGLLQGEGG